VERMWRDEINRFEVSSQKRTICIEKWKWKRVSRLHPSFTGLDEER
jgi:hypothetical protein